MSFAKRSAPIDLEAGLRTRPEDVAALRRAARSTALSLEEYLDFLATLGDPPHEVLKARRGPRGDRPFEL
jgi:hypothetical protein